MKTPCYIKESEEKRKMKFQIQYEVEAKDKSQARRIAIQTMPSEGENLAIYSLDEAGYIKGRVI